MTCSQPHELAKIKASAVNLMIYQRQRCIKQPDVSCVENRMFKLTLPPRDEDEMYSAGSPLTLFVLDVKVRSEGLLPPGTATGFLKKSYNLVRIQSLFLSRCYHNTILGYLKFATETFIRS